MLRAAGVRPQIAYRSADVQTIRALVGRNLAWSLLMEPVETSPEGRPLRFLPITDELGTNSILIAHPRGMRPSELARAVIDHSRRMLDA